MWVEPQINSELSRCFLAVFSASLKNVLVNNLVIPRWFSFFLHKYLVFVRTYKLRGLVLTLGVDVNAVTSTAECSHTEEYLYCVRPSIPKFSWRRSWIPRQGCYEDYEELYKAPKLKQLLISATVEVQVPCEKYFSSKLGVLSYSELIWLALAVLAQRRNHSPSSGEFPKIV